MAAWNEFIGRGEVESQYLFAAATTWLLSDAARYVTGAVIPVDAGAMDH
jgi:NAD(P)-dependent dehydrogenase (short-subunit alcohol dehydrogenase family)